MTGRAKGALRRAVLDRVFAEAPAAADGAGFSDSQSVKAHHGGPRGFDSGKTVSDANAIAARGRSG